MPSRRGRSVAAVPAPAPDGYARAGHEAGHRRVVSSGIPGLPWLVGRRDRPGRARRRLPAAPAGRSRRDGAAASASPSTAASACDRVGARGDGLPDQPAGAAPGRPDPDRDARPRRRAPIVIKVEADLSPIAAGNFVALAVVRLLRRDRLPPDRVAPGRHAVRHPGRRPDGRRHGRARLHDPGRAGHHALQARHGRDGPDAAAELARARSSSSSSTTRTPRSLASVQHVPDLRQRHVGDGRRPTRSSPRRAASETPAKPDRRSRPRPVANP